MTDVTWGAAIPVDGVRPDWLKGDDLVDWKWRADSEWHAPRFAQHEKGCKAVNLNIEGGVYSIRLPATHPHYAKSATPNIDLTAPLECYHPDGRVMPVSRVRKSTASSADIIIENAFYPPDCPFGYRLNGAPYDHSLSEWRIRNVPALNWDAPLEAVHTDGRVVPVTATEDTRISPTDKYPFSVSPRLVNPDAWWFKRDGTRGVSDWTIRNRAPEPATPRTATEALDRMEALEARIRTVTAELADAEAERDGALYGQDLARDATKDMESERNAAVVDRDKADAAHGCAVRDHREQLRLLGAAMAAGVVALDQIETAFVKECAKTAKLKRKLRKARQRNEAMNDQLGVLRCEIGAVHTYTDEDARRATVRVAGWKATTMDDWLGMVDTVAVELGMRKVDQ